MVPGVGVDVGNDDFEMTATVAYELLVPYATGADCATNRKYVELVLTC